MNSKEGKPGGLPFLYAKNQVDPYDGLKNYARGLTLFNFYKIPKHLCAIYVVCLKVNTSKKSTEHVFVSMREIWYNQ